MIKVSFLLWENKTTRDSNEHLKMAAMITWKYILLETRQSNKWTQKNQRELLICGKGKPQLLTVKLINFNQRITTQRMMSYSDLKARRVRQSIQV